MSLTMWFDQIELVCENIYHVKSCYGHPECQLLWLTFHLDTSIEHFAGSVWKPKRLKCLEKALGTLMRNFTHHVECSLKPDY